MKLVYCPTCHDVFSITHAKWRICTCKRSGGQYNRDMVTATIGGNARVFGVANPFFTKEWLELTEEQRIQKRIEYHYQEPHDCWWGDYKGDIQLFRITEPRGPRLKVRVNSILDSQPFPTMEVTIIDRRDYRVGDDRPDKVIVPHGVWQFKNNRRVNNNNHLRQT